MAAGEIYYWSGALVYRDSSNNERMVIAFADLGHTGYIAGVVGEIFIRVQGGQYEHHLVFNNPNHSTSRFVEGTPRTNWFGEPGEIWVEGDKLCWQPAGGAFDYLREHTGNLM